MTYRLILLRHGHSDWNAKNLFTGWVDVDLNAQGVEEAHRGGQLLLERDLLPDVLHTSVLRRAIRTATIALEECGRQWIDVRRSWRLNERHYGGLQGKDKKQTLEELGEEQFMLFRRSYDTPPPAIERGSEYDQFGDPRYAGLPSELLPATECLKDVVERMLPNCYDAIVPDLRARTTVLHTAHALDGRGNLDREFALRTGLDSAGQQDLPVGGLHAKHGRAQVGLRIQRRLHSLGNRAVLCNP